MVVFEGVFDYLLIEYIFYDNLQSSDLHQDLLQFSLSIVDQREKFTKFASARNRAQVLCAES